MLFLSHFLIYLNFFTFPAASVPVVHPFYVSVTEINHNAKERSLEVSVKIFTDDFENALKKKYSRPVNLIKPADKPIADSLVSDYIRQHLQIRCDGKSLRAHYLGYEHESEAVWCYLEIKGVPEPRAMEIINNLLYDYLDQQINMIHVTVNGKRKSAKLDYPETKIAFSF